MTSSETSGEDRGGGDMQTRRVTLDDGRYLIFYTFGEESASHADAAVGPRREPEEPKPSAEEERRV
jgi:hypothetical protein